MGEWHIPEKSDYCREITGHRLENTAFPVLDGCFVHAKLLGRDRLEQMES
jgi:hypothetical protein